MSSYKKVQLLGQISGTRNEVPWPPHKSVVELPEDEVDALIHSGQGRKTDEDVTHPEFGRAVLPVPERATAEPGSSDAATAKAVKEQAKQIAELTEKLESAESAKADEATTKAVEEQAKQIDELNKKLDALAKANPPKKNQ